MKITNQDELRRLYSGLLAGEVPYYATVSLSVAGDPFVYQKVHSALSVILQPYEPFPEDEQWLELLPRWLVDSFAESDDDPQYWSSFQWLTPFVAETGDREWRFWDLIEQDGLVILQLEVPDWPVLVGTAEFLLFAASAREVTIELN